MENLLAKALSKEAAALFIAGAMFAGIFAVGWQVYNHIPSQIAEQGRRMERLNEEQNRRMEKMHEEQNRRMERLNEEQNRRMERLNEEQNRRMEKMHEEQNRLMDRMEDNLMKEIRQLRGKK